MKKRHFALGAVMVVFLINFFGRGGVTVESDCVPVETVSYSFFFPEGRPYIWPIGNNNSQDKLLRAEGAEGYLSEFDSTHSEGSLPEGQDIMITGRLYKQTYDWTYRLFGTGEPHLAMEVNADGRLFLLFELDWRVKLSAISQELSKRCDFGEGLYERYPNDLLESFEDF